MSARMIPGSQQDVQRVQPGDEDLAGEVAAEQRPVHPGADHRDAQRDRRQRGPQPDAGEQVVGQRVAEVTLEHRQDQQQRADDPVGFAGTPERAGEEDAGQVHHDRRGEHQRRPVVDLADEQPAAHLEADVEGGLVGPRHLHTAQRLVHAVVGDLGHRRVEEQRQVHAGDQQDDEADTARSRPAGTTSGSGTPCSAGGAPPPTGDTANRSPRLVRLRFRPDSALAVLDS